MGKKVGTMTHLVEQLTDLSSETRPKRCRVFDSKLLQFEFSEAKKSLRYFGIPYQPLEQLDMRTFVSLVGHGKIDL